jgi:hypothetical protein
MYRPFNFLFIDDKIYVTGVRESHILGVILEAAVPKLPYLLDLPSTFAQ